MADFTALATSYVLADDEDEQQQLASKAADGEGIRRAPRKSAAVLSWAQSINQWMPNSSGDDADSDVIVRAKALGFLASTLEVLDKDVLRVEQVEHLIAFFGAMFSIDHKAGILAAATALRCLCAMSHFRPAMAAAVLTHLTKLGDDFRLQAPATRRAIYDLIAFLARDDAVVHSLHETYGPSAQFLLDLLQLCRHERDPDNLLRWFAILRRVLEHYSPLAPATAEEVFKVASDYFPISMRSSATPAGTTVDDLKAALRGCFLASSLAAASVFDFLLQKLDQGDALTVSVKVDILRTIHACVETFPNPLQTVAPYSSRIWNSLKFEVRHGEVPQTIDWTLRVIQAISTRLNDIPKEATDVPSLKDFVGLVLADCISDLSNSTFTKPAGELLNATVRGGFRAFILTIAPILAAEKKDLQQSGRTANHIRDLLAFLNNVLRTRQGLIDEKDKKPEASTPESVVAEFHSHDAAILGLLESVYLRLWNNTLGGVAAPAATTSGSVQSQDPAVLTEVIRGLAALIVQRGPSSSPSGTRLLLCSAEECTKIFETLVPRILYASSPAQAGGAPFLQGDFQTLAHEAMLALQTATSVYPEGFIFLVEKTVTSITGSPATLTSLTPLSPEALTALTDTLSRVAYIGCGTIPAIDSHPTTNGGRPLFHFLTLTQALYATLERLLDAKIDYFQVSNAVLSGIYGAILNLREAFAQQGVVSSTDKTKKQQQRILEADDNKSASLLPVFQAYLGEATAIVRRLYSRATATVEAGAVLALSADFDLPPSSSSPSALDDQDQYLHQLSSLATFVIRDLDEAHQRDTKLYEAAFNLFHSEYTGKPAFFNSCQAGRTDVLSLGILKGLWPSTIASIADLPLSTLDLLDDFDSLDTLPLRTRLVRNGIATVVANKYSAAASAGASKAQYPGNQAEWQKTVEAAKARLAAFADSSTMSSHPVLTANQFARLVAIAAGAIARMDKDIKELAGLLAFTPASHASHRSNSSSSNASAALQMARLLGGLLVSDRSVLSADDHAVVKSISKQWLYGQTVKPLLPLAFPRKAATGAAAALSVETASDADAVAAAKRASTVHTVAILALVRGMPFSVYEDDVDSDGGPLVRILVAAATSLAPQWSDVAVALRVLSTVLAANRADALRGHLKTVVDGAIRVFAAGAGAGAGTTLPPPPTPACRKQALELVAQLPAHYEEGLLLPYEPRLARALAAACGDRVREIREVAQRARESWSRVAA